jgi:proton-translocating NADH-quinone oxidoreductase chain N
MWTPDVYEGAPTPVTAFFAAAPKVAGIAIFARATVVAFPGITHEWQQIVVFVSIASMALGSFAAIGQRNIKRLMAYSSIGHMGYALVGLAAGTPEGVQGVLVYMSIYVAMTLGTFAVILSMRRDGKLVENISDLSGLARTHPTMAFFLAVLLFSLAGIPPLAGFSQNSMFSLLPSRPGFSHSPSLAYSPAWWALTTIWRSSRSCISTSQLADSSACRRCFAWFSASRVSSTSCSSSIRRRS